MLLSYLCCSSFYFFTCTSLSSNGSYICEEVMAGTFWVSKANWSEALKWFCFEAILHEWTLETERILLPWRLQRPTWSICKQPYSALLLLTAKDKFWECFTFVMELEVKPAVALDKQSLTAVFLSIFFFSWLCQTGSYLIYGPIII